ncbi:MAG: hypothetical protein IJ106_03115 [Parasporobacterium sp.]|nr:hypothetical protein [Parasporobacterium sp.]
MKKKTNLCRCPDCRNIISVKAKSCPHCGRVLRRSSTNGKILAILLCIIGFIMLFIGAYHIGLGK